jgi:hypothetical protein
MWALEIDGKEFVSRLEQAQKLRSEIRDSNKLSIDQKENLDFILSDPKIKRMVEENEFIEIIVPLIEKLPNYIHLAKVV